jgi:toxin ParE1/3/4
MEIEITAEQEAQLALIAAHLHKDPHQLVIEAALQLINEDDRFRAGVRKGIEEADRGELIDEAEMDARIERMLQRWMRLRWTSAAANDLENISNYLHQKHPQVAQPTVRRLYAEIRELSRFPSRGRPGREPGTRELILTDRPYVVIFRAGDQLVEILRIYHGSQNWKWSH